MKKPIYIVFDCVTCQIISAHFKRANAEKEIEKLRENYEGEPYFVITEFFVSDFPDYNFLDEALNSGDGNYRP